MNIVEKIDMYLEGKYSSLSDDELIAKWQNHPSKKKLKELKKRKLRKHPKVFPLIDRGM